MQMYNRCGDGEDDFIPLKDGLKTGYELKMGGLTKREYFAILAMQGLMSNPLVMEKMDNDRCSKPFEKSFASAAIKTADELLKQLS